MRPIPSSSVSPCVGTAVLVLLAGVLAAPAPAIAQAPTPGSGSLATVAVEGVTLKGPLETTGGRAALGNNSTVTAGDRTAELTLQRGGSLRICTSTSVHLSRDAAPLPRGKETGTPDDAGLMVALDRGALEASYPTGRYSDVLLTPDLRILVSGPGTANLKLRVNRQGDTCIDNHGDNAPYVTVSSLMDGGVYRVQPNQRVLFERGSLAQVVDREPEPCGCPAPPASAPLQAGKPLGGPSSTPADTAFPTAVSEGLAPAPTGPTTPVAPPGQVHAQVTASLSNDTPPTPPPGLAAAAAPPAAALPAPTPVQAGRRSFFGRIGHFFARVLGAH